MFKRQLAVLLVLTAVACFWFTKHYTDTLFGKAFYSDKGTHVQLAVALNVTDKQQLFADTLNQARQQLGEKRDFIDVFDDSTWRRRNNHVSGVCRLLEKSTSHKTHLSYYETANVLFCGVAKVASKFWSRMLHVMDTDDHISPFDFAAAGNQQLNDRTKHMSESDRIQYTQKLFNTTFKFVFSRDPYKRIYSSYLDKFLSPNAEFWHYMGRRIVAFSRKSPSNRSLECGHDVTFGELVKYLVARDPLTYDQHFKPVSASCDVCNIQFDLIGKVETFKHDVMYILNRTHAKEKNIVFKDFAQENSIHFIIFNAKRTFDLKKGALQCVTDHVVHLRLWRQIQIAGLIGKYDEYPLTPEESREANLTIIINLLLDAYHRSTSETKKQSKEAYYQAYSEVSLEDMEKLRVKYLKDILLFDYDDRPDELFGEGRTNLDKLGGDFDYFNALQLG